MLRPRESTIEGKYGVSNVVYKLKLSVCDRCYIGYTKHPINIRSAEHCVKTSVLSKAHLNIVLQIPYKKEDFSILCSGISVFDLKVKEAYFKIVTTYGQTKNVR